jgi:hypothetical protein
MKRNFIKLVKKFAKIVFPPYDDFVIEVNHDDFAGYDVNIKVEDRRHHNCIDFSVILHGSLEDSGEEDSGEEDAESDNEYSSSSDDDDAFKRIKGEIFINHLDKCESGSGTELLKKIEYLAKLIGINRLGLYDGSTIKTDCGTSFPLKTLYTLATGQTWYNSKGFIDPYNHKKTKKHNMRIIKTKMKDFLETLREDDFLADSVENIRERTHLSINNISVKDYFIRAKKILQESRDCNAISEFCYLLNKIKHDGVIQEGYELEKIIDAEPRCDECDEEESDLTKEGLCTYCALERYHDEKEAEEIEQMGSIVQVDEDKDNEEENVSSRSKSLGKSSSSLSPIIESVLDIKREKKTQVSKKRRIIEPKPCKEGKEKVNGRCVKKCKEGETRNEKRKCAKVKKMTIKAKKSKT